ncbi:MAG TPA: hypothetical protein VFT43_11410 [Candidatus Polarisedimenticolia bacterium]|nr:hypothetical protein [Candidatus Polarisedimenticolia bacterium]
MLRTAPRRFAVALASALLILPALTYSGEGEGTDGEARDKKDKPKLHLIADPAVGFTPVTVVLTGQLSGVSRQDPNFCHAAVTWIRIDPGQSEEEGFKVREDPVCLHPKEEVFVPTSFTKTFVLGRPGSYLVRLMVEGKDGTRIVSSYSKIEVLRVQ